MDLPDDEVSPGSPKRGRPARINRQMLVDAARSLDREGLTLQAVADRLGVDRKALSYHVAGRQELIDLVATQTISQELGGLELPLEWDAAIYSWAEATRRAMLREGSMALVIDHLPGDALPHLRRVPLARDPLQGAEDQARFDIDLVVAGLQHHLVHRST